MSKKNQIPSNLSACLFIFPKHEWDLILLLFDSSPTSLTSPKGHQPLFMSIFPVVIPTFLNQWLSFLTRWENRDGLIIITHHFMPHNLKLICSHDHSYLLCFIFVSSLICSFIYSFDTHLLSITTFKTLCRCCRRISELTTIAADGEREMAPSICPYVPFPRCHMSSELSLALMPTSYFFLSSSSLSSRFKGSIFFYLK